MIGDTHVYSWERWRLWSSDKRQQWRSVQCLILSSSVFYWNLRPTPKTREFALSSRWLASCLIRCQSLTTQNEQNPMKFAWLFSSWSFSSGKGCWEGANIVHGYSFVEFTPASKALLKTLSHGRERSVLRTLLTSSFLFCSSDTISLRLSLSLCVSLVCFFFFSNDDVIDDVLNDTQNNQPTLCIYPVALFRMKATEKDEKSNRSSFSVWLCIIDWRAKDQ